MLLANYICLYISKVIDWKANKFAYQLNVSSGVEMGSKGDFEKNPIFQSIGSEIEYWLNINYININ
jgi:hypothetical protein